MRNASITIALAALLSAACSQGPESATPDTARAASVTRQPVVDTSLLVTVYKSPTCGCCAAWVDHMRSAGFRVATVDTADVSPIKQQHGVPPHLGSCHTAVVGKYVVEGHVPAEDIRRLLAERPDVRGLAVPGMPVGSPGMEGAYHQAYEVIAFGPRGESRVFAKH